mmetsp:Transcript_8690/g.22239  ORF Transcript_8690/g.22239 Transcript_8690/m.22239 type:complete len:382 (+) Transcript_8690:90-1235(+)|eukprot:CAMPEP_0183406518 /NCGR_PEP_ID=MMETSP0370-20130417/16647_1 /TAXON_ID=268820 /ORGANISM="Peridinium aciculiferum, Strain PAER-2" /LENGTH=381 /DNA_ID=CAMNT_0025588701 /DNA_START=87 /DNA_END=1232 /DNA_ORIENTATION=-
MPSGHLMTMPVLIVNMGGEMVYILEQRLQAQKIPDAKGQKVLNDVVRTMYYPRFIEELFKPQEMYSIQSTRQIFDRLAHSSIMRLNESSMDKLFDLMAMGFKYQIISCQAPQEMVDVTQNHLDVLKRLVGNTSSVLELVEECIRQVQVAYGGMTLSDFNAMRQSLCRFFQDRKVKVSLFLHDQTQNPDGSIVVPSSGTLQATSHFPPGTVRYIQGGQEVSRDQLPTVSANSWAPASGVRTALGGNVYEKDRQAPAEALPAAAPHEAAAPGALPPAAAPGTAPQDLAKRAAAVGELNLLASLIGNQPASGDEHFKLESLFSANVFGIPDAGGATSEVIQIDGRAPTQHTQNLEAIRQQMDLSGPAGDAGDSPDLLDLMDNAN